MNPSPAPSCALFRYLQPLVLSATLAVGLGAALSHAESVSVPLGQQSKVWNVQVPSSGLSKAQVEARYGAPVKTMGPIGEPPIYVWDYEQFTVYFESDAVIHSVVKFRPQGKSPSSP